jgi:hypothetical protein
LLGVAFSITIPVLGYKGGEEVGTRYRRRSTLTREPEKRPWSAGLQSAYAVDVEVIGIPAE